ncbi:MAG: XdhC family protein [Streptosporangiaceae bacterium]|nr:XdhC family protein [Streptosporangiaceae bacterium]MBV9857044.1 XdhC family protein [Streptosporangiaceae bacterium]
MSRVDLLERASELRARRTPFVVATVVRAQRPTSAKPGDCALLLPDGTIEGFVGGECSESTVRAQGLRQLAAGRSTLLRITPPDAVGPPAEGIVTVGNPCLSGGSLDIFLEVMRPPMLVYVYGATPVARSLSEVGRAAGWEMRPVPGADAAVAPDTSAVVVASQGSDEHRVLRAALRAGVPYVGLVASRRRGASVADALGLDSEQRERLHTPAGLDIGAHAPGEVAVSIVAEIIKAAAGAPAPSGAPVMPELPQATDPVCGMTVAVTAATARLSREGTTVYFCCPGCRDAFAADPGRYTRTL